MPIQVSDIIEPSGPFPVIDASNMRGGFRAVASSVPGGGTPSVEAQLTALVGGVNNISQGMLAFDTRTSKFYQLGADSQWAETSFAGSDTYDSQAFNDAVERELLVNLPTDGGVLDIAKETTLQGFSSTLTTVQSGIAGLQYLSTYFTDAALPETPTSTGFLKYDTGTSAWSLASSTASAPTEINGGNASSFAD